MTEPDDFFEDQEAIDAGDRLRTLSTAPTVRLAADGATLKFQVKHQNLKDAVLTATLKDKIKEADYLSFGVGEHSIQVFSQFRGIQTWVTARKADGETDERMHNFGLSHAIASKVAALEGIGSIDAQILLGVNGNNDGDELRLKLASTRARLTVAPSPPISAAHAPIQHKVVPLDPRALRIAIRQALSIVKASSETTGIVTAEEGSIYAGGHKALIVISDPGLAEINFKIAATDCRVLDRILGRMHPSRSFFYVHDDFYVFGDDIIRCKAVRASGGPLPVGKVMATPAFRTFFPVTPELKRIESLLSLTSPTRVTLSAKDGAEHITLFAHNLKPSEIGQGSLAVRQAPDSASGPWNMVVEGNVWSAAIRVFDYDARVELQTLKGDSVLRLVGITGESTVTVFLSRICG